MVHEAIIERVMIPIDKPTDTISRAIHSALEKEIERIVKEEAGIAAETVKTRVRERTTAIASNILEHFTMERMGSELVIRVNFENIK